MHTATKSRREYLATSAARDLASYVKRGCRGTRYKYTTRSPMAHAACENVESSEFSGIYTCHDHLVQGIN